MNGRARIRAALGHDGAGEIGAVVPYEGIFARDHWEQFTRFPWWLQASPDPVHAYSWRRDLVRELGSDWFQLPMGALREEQDAIVLVACGATVLRLDRRTGESKPVERPPVGGWTAHGEAESVRAAPPATYDEVDARMPPPPEDDPRRVRTDGAGAAAMMLMQDVGTTRFPVVHVSAPLWSLYGRWGFEALMTMVADTPDVLAHACERALAWAIRAVRRGKALGAEGVWVEDCLTDLVRPEAYAALNLPTLQRLVAAISEAGMRSIYYYCGDPWSRWEHILAVGADALSLEEGKKGFDIDIVDVLERVAGRCAVLGNLDAIGVLQDGDDEALRAEIARQVRAARRLGTPFVMSLGSPVTPGTPIGRVRRYCELAREMGTRV